MLKCQIFSTEKNVGSDSVEVWNQDVLRNWI